MTKLINADALFTQMKEYLDKRNEEANMTGNRAADVTWDDAVMLIKNASPVDAIPIKWLTAQAENPSNSDMLRNAIDYIVYTLWAERKEK